MAESLRVRKVHSVEDCDVTLEVSVGIIYTTVAAGTPADDLEFTLTSTDGPLSYSLSVDHDWVSFSPPVSDPSGMSDTITVSLDTEGLGPGIHDALISATPTDGSMVVPLPVQLSILPPDPQMQVSTNQLDFTPTNGGNPVAQAFTVHNPGFGPGSGPLNYRIRPDQPWVFESPDVGTSWGELDPISISVDAGGLGVGVHNATVAVEQVDGELVEMIDVVLTVAPGSMTDLTAASFTASTQAGTEESIDFSVSVMNAGFGTNETFRAGIYLSVDEAVESDDIFLGFCELSGLASGATMDCPGTAALPAGVTAGTYYLGVIVDDLGAILESDDTNNIRTADTGTILVQGDGCPADLALPNHTLSGTQTLEATATATLGPNLTVNGDDIAVNAPIVTIMGGTSISGIFSVGNSPACP